MEVNSQELKAVEALTKNLQAGYLIVSVRDLDAVRVEVMTSAQNTYKIPRHIYMERFSSLVKTTKGSYHNSYIPKGKIGEFSKIEEEFLECMDAACQNNPIMLFLEFADLFGAIQRYIEKHHKGVITLEDILKQARLTNRVFDEGGRKD